MIEVVYNKNTQETKVSFKGDSEALNLEFAATIRHIYDKIINNGGSKWQVLMFMLKSIKKASHLEKLER